MPSIFSRIAAGEISSYKVAEDERHFAFLDINPAAEGHVLVIPRRETDYIFDLADEDYTALTLFAKRVAAAIKRAIPCKKVGMAVIGLDVPHAHIHLLPLQTGREMDFGAPKLSLPEERMREIAASIAANFE